MKFKKIYIEITNICNLNCSFCLRTTKPRKEMSLSEFEEILQKIENYTDYIYLHVQGEPLLHSNFDGILKLCSKYNKKVNITTNGVFLKEKLDIINRNSCVRQINISLHSENKKENYFDDIFYSVSKLNKEIYVSYRIWISDRESLIIDKLKKYYGDSILKIYNKNNVMLDKNTYLNKDEEFIWPDINNNYFNEYGTCLGLKSHIGILSDGTVIVCCLDSNGNSNLGNIFNSSIDEILNNSKHIIDNFNNNKCVLDICKHCSFKDKFN